MNSQDKLVPDKLDWNGKLSAAARGARRDEADLGMSDRIGWHWRRGRCSPQRSRSAKQLRTARLRIHDRVQARRARRPDRTR